MESTLRISISPPLARANSWANADLPVAVAPTRATAMPPWFLTRP